MSGPHLHEQDDGYALEFWQKSGSWFRRRDKQVAPISIKGAVEDWHRAARLTGVPIVTREAKLDGSDRPLELWELSG